MDNSGSGAASLEADLCVVGAGPVGGTLACLAAGAGLRVVVIDRAALPPMEHPAFDGRAYAIAAGSRRILEQAGLWAALPLPACAIHEIRVSDGAVGRPASPLFLHFGVRELPDSDAESAFGWMIEARSLRRAMNARLHATAGVTVLAPAEAQVTRSAEGAQVRVAGGPVVACRLVVAADGRESALRRQAGIAVTRHAYNQTGIVNAIAHERPHNNVALEHFLPAGPFAQLPMSGGEAGPNISAIVWTERSARAPGFMALDDAAFAHQIARRMGGHLGAIRPVGRRWSYPLSALHAQRYFDTRLALVGDAAHGIHPIAGQGLNLGFRDVAALAGLLAEAHAAGDDIGGAGLLLRYQRARRPDNLLMLAATDGLDRLFSSDNPVLRLARRVGIAGVHRTPRLKQAFMRMAMGV
jgi:2-octaprenyl-6-methoxyphenol hydroxylase